MKKPGQWWTKSWTPAVGCDMSLPCAAHCWARPQAHMHARHPNPQIAEKYAGITDDAGRWTGTVRLDEPTLDAPLHWRGPQVVAVSLMGDLFHEHLPDSAIDRIYAVMAALCPQHTFVVLTKRAERRYRWHTEHTGWSVPVGGTCVEIDRDEEYWMSSHPPFDNSQPWPLPNVIEMISASTQAELDERWGWLARTPAAWRGLHLEPLELLNLKSILGGQLVPNYYGPGAGTWIMPDWVVVGGETGPDARPMHPGWVRAIRDQCQAVGVPFWFKGWGQFRPADFGTGTDPEPIEMVRVRRQSAGRLLDGREWNEVAW